ncbi:epoxide hydrolase 4-like [Impatiens glandulifera]|uniref:epoxide hydrolase 4-like n=1 Tax=Impatiens glandulifera TaxID=253017 RepID=UPI001FB0873C|nr:epoxide hydrolase 4-like [Impatiens glandulifera]
MVNIFDAVTPLLHGLMKLTGVTPKSIEIEPGTIIKIWLPKQQTKPAIVFLHCFSMDGIFNWFPQVLSLSNRYSVYVPDLLFFGGSTTDQPERSAGFQAQCMAHALRKVGVEKCTIVGLSYGGMVGFKMAELYPDLVDSIVVSSTVMELTETISNDAFQRLNITNWSEFMLPETVAGVKNLFSVSFRTMNWLPSFFYKHLLEVTSRNKKEKIQLLEALVVKDNDIVPQYSQKICLLWGGKDKIFGLEVARNIKEKLGEKACLEYIEKGGHLLQIEWPFAYNTSLNKILDSLYPNQLTK